MTKILTREEILAVLPQVDAIGAVERGFAAYSAGKAIVPPVGELMFENPPGETHIKYGYIEGQPYYVIKVGCGFYENAKRGLSTRNGLMLVLRRDTGEIAFILQDQGLLTDVRTAAAGAVAAKYLAPKRVARIGIVGAGGQGRAQAQYLRGTVDCDDLIVWGVDQAELDRYRADVEAFGFRIATTRRIEEVMESCNLVVTATPSRRPLILPGMMRPGTHVSAFGSDTPEKIELDPLLFREADLICVDSREQSKSRGEIHHARAAGVLEGRTVHELGEVINGVAPTRADDRQTTIIDLTGVAVQDIEICRVVCERFE
jgi:ornithine cyclodeaminase